MAKAGKPIPPACDKPGPTQILRPEKVEDADRIPEPKVTATVVLRPEIARDPDILVQTKKDANERRHLAAQLPYKVLAAIYTHLDRHPDAGNSEIARWLKADPEIAPLVAHLEPPSLAKKIGKLRK